MLLFILFIKDTHFFTVKKRKFKVYFRLRLYDKNHKKRKDEMIMKYKCVSEILSMTLCASALVMTGCNASSTSNANVQVIYGEIEKVGSDSVLEQKKIAAILQTILINHKKYHRI